MVSREAFDKVIDLALVSFPDMDRLFLEHLNLEEQMLRDLIEIKENEEPFFHFTRAHKKWEAELSGLNSELLDLYKRVEDLIDEISKQ